MLNAECKMKVSPPGIKMKEAIKERFLQAIKKFIRICLRVLFIPKGYHHLAFSIQHFAFALRETIIYLMFSIERSG